MYASTKKLNIIVFYNMNKKIILNVFFVYYMNKKIVIQIIQYQKTNLILGVVHYTQFRSMHYNIIFFGILDQIVPVKNQGLACDMIIRNDSNTYILNRNPDLGRFFFCICLDWKLNPQLQETSSNDTAAIQHYRIKT